MLRPVASGILRLGKRICSHQRRERYASVDVADTGWEGRHPSEKTALF
jgi:hypothetical protein